MNYPTSKFEIKAIEESIKQKFPEFTEIKYFQIDFNAGFKGKVLINGFEFFVNQDRSIIGRDFIYLLETITKDLDNTISTFKRIVSSGQATDFELASVILHRGSYEDYIDFNISIEDALLSAQKWLDYSENNAFIAIGHIYQEYVEDEFEEDIPF